MTENLLQAAERTPIESLLKNNAGLGQPPTFERLLGYITGAVMTPGGFEPSEWLQPLFDSNGIVFKNVEDIESFMATLLSLYERIDDMKLRKETIFPFDLSDVEVIKEPTAVIDWATGFHAAVISQEDIWIPYEDEAACCDESLMTEVNLGIQCLGALVNPKSIPEIVKDPVPFQRNFLKECLGWREDMVRETWDDELVEYFKLFCLGRLDRIVTSLRLYAAAYDNED